MADTTFAVYKWVSGAQYINFILPLKSTNSTTNSWERAPYTCKEIRPKIWLCMSLMPWCKQKGRSRWTQVHRKLDVYHLQHWDQKRLEAPVPVRPTTSSMIVDLWRSVIITFLLFRNTETVDMCSPRWWEWAVSPRVTGSDTIGVWKSRFGRNIWFAILSVPVPSWYALSGDKSEVR